MMADLADLHRHLDGSVRPSTLQELAQKSGLTVPKDLCFTPGMGLQAALSRFEFTLSVLQSKEAVARVAHEICEDAHNEGIRTLEIRFAPQLHDGAPIPDIVDAALAGISGRAGLLLCALYGEPPEIAEALVNTAIPRKGVVGIDLAGGPAPGHKWTMKDLAPAFRRARKHGIGRTVHAGEGRPAIEIREAIEHLHAQRIGHGLSVLDDPRVADLVREQGVTLEACPTSNWQVGVIPAIESHPMPKWRAAELKFCINTDNTLLSDIDLPEECRRAAGIAGVGLSGVKQAQNHGHEAKFSR